MPTDLNQIVWLKGLPEGLDFTVTAVTPFIPDKSGWRAGFTHFKHGHITANERDGSPWDYLTVPFKVSPSEDDGLLGHFKMAPNNGVYCTGPGGRIDVTFTIEGTTTIDGTAHTIPKTTGYISVSSSDWGGLGRPDYSNVTYSVAGSPPVNLSVQVKPNIGVDPDDAYIVGAVGKDDSNFALNATTHSDTLKTVLSDAIRGILFVNEKLAGWASGKILPS
ncbi:hypothetical protein DFP72DRAFT_1007593 [Ephemerocybe angulata]|uniref:Uncharacterized protein n=1 Tax=Ephemerocybe angulata TaxID=980116 RepID=A0A8H6I090_9AGAR|nr:hypothetical protein DFP72DRAFT_1007593 [Tulosesus angulatus]